MEWKGRGEARLVMVMVVGWCRRVRVVRKNDLPRPPSLSPTSPARPPTRPTCQKCERADCDLRVEEKKKERRRKGTGGGQNKCNSWVGPQTQQKYPHHSPLASLSTENLYPLVPISPLLSSPPLPCASPAPALLGSARLPVTATCPWASPRACAASRETCTWTRAHCARPPTAAP